MPDLNAPTPERLRRSAFVVGSAVATEAGPARAGARVYRSLPALERLARSGTISPRQLLAGERFRDDHELGVAGAREPAGGSSGPKDWHYTEARIAAVRRWRGAMNRLGLMTVYVLPVVIGEPGGGDMSIAQLARFLRQNRQEVAGVLKIGLDVLACYYEIE